LVACAFHGWNPTTHINSNPSLFPVCSLVIPIHKVHIFASTYLHKDCIFHGMLPLMKTHFPCRTSSTSPPPSLPYLLLPLYLLHYYSLFPQPTKPSLHQSLLSIKKSSLSLHPIQTLQSPPFR
jgi:hypothetical protein